MILEISMKECLQLELKAYEVKAMRIAKAIVKRCPFMGVTFDEKEKWVDELYPLILEELKP